VQHIRSSEPTTGKLAHTVRAQWFSLGIQLSCYHKEGSRFYGTAKKGKYMTETEAINEGNKAGAERH